jgi:hypothetical protein
MLLFQQLEGLLKYVISGSNLSGYASQLERKQAKQSASTHKQTLGTLVGQYVEDILGPETDDSDKHPEEVTDIYISTKFRLGHNEAFYEETKTWLAKLVDDRNELVHHLLPQLDTTSAESCEAIGHKLEAQAKTIRHAIRHMQSIAKAMNASKRKMSALLQSPEGISQMFGH